MLSLPRGKAVLRITVLEPDGLVTLALSLKVSETLNTVMHLLGKDSQMLVLNIHFYSNLTVPKKT